MKKFTILMACMLMAVFVLSALAADQVNVLGYSPTAYSRVTVTTSAVTRLSSTERDTAGAVFITIEGNNIRYRIDGGLPSVNFGHLIVASAYQNIWLNDPASIKSFRMISLSGNAIVHITYYKRN